MFSHSKVSVAFASYQSTIFGKTTAIKIFIDMHIIKCLLNRLDTIEYSTDLNNN